MIYDPNSPIYPGVNKMRDFTPEEAEKYAESLDNIFRPLNVSNPILRNKVPVKIKRLHPDAVIPRYATELAAGFDLVAVEDVIIEPGETALIRTGIAVQLPEGYEMQIRPRSGISKKTKLRVSNSPGTVDADYTGEVGVLIDNISLPGYEIHAYGNGIDDEHVSYSIEAQKSPAVFGVTNNLVFPNGKERLISKPFYPVGTYIIRKGDRIAQAVICEAPQAVFVEVDELDDTKRGTGGFGSSGVRA
jgi:dUTP pyrophosphatase